MQTIEPRTLTLGGYKKPSALQPYFSAPKTKETQAVVEAAPVAVTMPSLPLTADEIKKQLAEVEVETLPLSEQEDEDFGDDLEFVDGGSGVVCQYCGSTENALLRKAGFEDDGTVDFCMTCVEFLAPILGEMEIVVEDMIGAV